MVKVGIEGVPFFGNLTGVGQYATRLIQAGSKLDSDIQFDIVRSTMPHRKFIPPLPENDHLHYRVIKWLPPIVYYQLFKRIGWAPAYDLVALRKYDVFMFFNFVAFPLRRKTKSLLVIYDLSFVTHPQFSSPKNLNYLKKFVPGSINGASKVITISNNSKKEIIKHYKISPDKISIITPAIDHKLFNPRAENEINLVKRTYGIKKSYILSVCTLEPRKNLIGVLDAFENLPEKLKDKYSLVLVGGKGWLDGELEKKFEELKSKYSLIKTGYVPDEDLPALYSGASLFVYPSFYEGFGMPPLEAMACGVPVITSNNSSLPEVVGDAAIMVDAHDTGLLADKIQLVLSDNKVASKMIEKGRLQALKFDWDKSAKNLIEVIQEVAS